MKRKEIGQHGLVNKGETDRQNQRKYNTGKIKKRQKSPQNGTKGRFGENNNSRINKALAKMKKRKIGMNFRFESKIGGVRPALGKEIPQRGGEGMKKSIGANFLGPVR